MISHVLWKDMTISYACLCYCLDNELKIANTSQIESASDLFVIVHV
jgi:hypothetical protein